MFTPGPLCNRRPRVALCVVVMLCLFAGAAAPARAGSGALGLQFAERPARVDSPASAPDDESKRLPPNVAPAEAARRASREYGGRVLNVVLEEGPGGPYYRVKLLDGGRVRVVHVEARH